MKIKNIVNFSADVNPIEFYNDIKNKIFITNYIIANPTDLPV